MPNGYDGYVLEYARSYNEENTAEQMKEGIKNYGGITIGISDKSNRKGSFDGYYTMHGLSTDDIDHEVLIIGWDDNFPKSYFTFEAEEDGAWLCLNSKSESWGENGTYWVSYETPICENTIFAVSNEYSHVTAYDFGNENRISTGDETTVANVFHEQGTLSAVGTYTSGDNQKYTIEIYDDQFQTLLCSVDAEMDINGYQIVELPEPIEVSDYAIVIRFQGSAPVEGESYDIDNGRSQYIVSCEEGQSFVLIDGQWEDLAKETTKEKLNIDFTPNNACIKAVYK